MLDPATDVDLVAGASFSVANVSGCQYFSCQCLWLPVSVASFTGCQYLSCQSLSCRVLQLPVPLPQLLVPLYQLPVSRLLVPKLPVPLRRLPVSAGALAGVQVLCHGRRGYHQASCETETIVEDTHESSTQMSCRPSQFQTLITSNNNRSGYM